MIRPLVNRLPTSPATQHGCCRFLGVLQESIFSAGKCAILSWGTLKTDTSQSSFDGKVKVWSIDTKTCVATHSETEKAVWSVKWLPKTGKSEGFATAGANRSVAFYREATGG